MKKSIVFLVLITLVTVSCKNDKKTEALETEVVEISKKLPFEGIWTRSFELGKDSIQHVFYRIWADSIQYEMQGSLPVKYTMHRDTFISKDNRWIGKLNDVPYVVFAKDLSADSITIYKKQIKTQLEAIELDFPSKKDSSHYSSWNVYYQKS